MQIALNTIKTIYIMIITIKGYLLTIDPLRNVPSYANAELSNAELLRVYCTYMLSVTICLFWLRVVCSSSSFISLELSKLLFMGLFNDELCNSVNMCSINVLECGYNV